MNKGGRPKKILVKDEGIPISERVEALAAIFATVGLVWIVVRVFQWVLR
jgi:hypothetical protein